MCKNLFRLNRVNAKILSGLAHPVPRIQIRIRQIRMFLGPLDADPDPLVKDMNSDPSPDPDPSITKQKL